MIIDLPYKVQQQLKLNKMSNLTKKFIVFAGVSLLLVSCGASTTCDAYSYIQNKNNNQVNQQQELQKLPIQNENHITHVEYGTI